ncbi:hypothetical protein GWI33_008856 [Rhynchophorus ferrugineus]|uniref:V-type proton ATPase subunit F n=1 Tax=Rhynchophorus ferrugineus TaxID=354439 RepID=A0A834IFL8_RHYFE|nr:hypothetical protein GWI33_008856 [Rhynchophorus ferrugineus]
MFTDNSYLLDDESINFDGDEDEEEYIKPPRLIAIIGDEDTCAGFVLAGIGEVDDLEIPNYFIADSKTDDYLLEKAFDAFTHRDDIGIVLITREASEKISNKVKNYKSVDPAVLVIPGHNGPYEIDLPQKVQIIEDRRKQGSRRGSTASNTSVKTTQSHQSISASRRSSIHSIKSLK